MPLHLVALFIICSSGRFAIERNVTDEEIKHFYKALPDQGVRVARYQNRGLGIQVKKDVSEGGLVYCIDEDQMITAHDDFPLYPYITHLSYYERLKVRVLYERFMAKRGNLFTDYIYMLPVEVIHPEVWSKEELDYFKEVNILNTTDDKLSEESEHKEYLKAVESIENLPKEMLNHSNYIWASFIVRSRYFHYNLDSGGETGVLIPFLDLPNHSPSPYKYHDDGFFLISGGKVCLRSAWPLQKGDEFTIQYSRHDAKHFFLVYDIVIENNPYDFGHFTYKGNLNVEDQESSFYLFADRINLGLLEAFTYDIGLKVYFQKKLRKFWRKDARDDEKVAILKGLAKYKITISEEFKEVKPGIREFRRNKGTRKSFVLEQIALYGLATRLTVYNHVKAIDRELLFALDKLI